ncbi:hypothetical protein ACFY7C_03260 [Streptomyces sp. NPDC012769]|uniref:hypothetical protein n=1 Tax=Streptomyces sp. NPDC012769 TaxID=3364848 RepID=UPI003696DC37
MDTDAQHADGADTPAPDVTPASTDAPAPAPAPAEAAAPRDSRWPVGCAVAMIVGFVLFVLGALALTEFEKGLDGDGQLEQAGASGSFAEPLGPGATARYEDGLKITVSAPRPDAGGRTYAFTVTYENDTDEVIHPGGDSLDGSVSTSTYGQAPLVVRAGESRRDDAAGYGLDWPDWRATATALMPPLGEGETRTVPVRIQPTRKGIPVTVQIAPPDPGYRETAHFQLTLN